MEKLKKKIIIGNNNGGEQKIAPQKIIIGNNIQNIPPNEDHPTGPRLGASNLQKLYEEGNLKKFSKKMEEEEEKNITDKNFLYPTLNLSHYLNY